MTLRHGHEMSTTLTQGNVSRARFGMTVILRRIDSKINRYCCLRSLDELLVTSEHPITLKSSVNTGMTMLPNEALLTTPHSRKYQDTSHDRRLLRTTGSPTPRVDQINTATNVVKMKRPSVMNGVNIRAFEVELGVAVFKEVCEG